MCLPSMSSHWICGNGRWNRDLARLGAACHGCRRRLRHAAVISNARLPTRSSPSGHHESCAHNRRNGTGRRLVSRNLRLRFLGIADRVKLIDGNLTDLSSLIRCMREAKPDEVYNLGAQSFVMSSWRQPLLTSNVICGRRRLARVLLSVCASRSGAVICSAFDAALYGRWP